MKYGMSIEEIHELTGIDPWFLDNLAEIVEMEDELRASASLRALRRRPAAQGQAVRLLRPAVGHASGTTTEMDVRARAQAARHRGHVQVGRHLRRRVRGLHALLLLDLRRRGRNAAQEARQAAGDDPRRRAEPHRPGHRVRLLLLPRQLRPARAGHRVDHGQLEPRDRQHRLRHQRPAVLRAADDRGRAEHLRPRPARRRDRAVRRPDAAEPGPGAVQRRRADHRHQRRHDRGRRGPREVHEHPRTAGPEAAGQRHRPQHGPGPRPKSAKIGFPGAGAAELRARRPGDGNLLRREPSSSASWPRRSSSPRASRC